MELEQVSDRMPVPVPAKPQWADVLALRAENIGNLARGWDGPGSVAVRRDLLLEAVRMVEKSLIYAWNAVAPFLVPAGDGSLQIEWHAKNGELEFDLAVDGSRSIWIRDYRFFFGDEIEGDDDRADALFSCWAAWVASVGDDDVVPASNSTVTGAYGGPSPSPEASNR